MKERTLSGLTNEALHQSAQASVWRETESTLSVLEYLMEIDRRDLHLELGFDSLFRYCTDELGYSESAAGRRIAAARAMARFGQIIPMFRQRRVNLTTLSLVAKKLSPETVEGVLGAIDGKSRREVEVHLSRMEPRVRVPRDRIKPIHIKRPKPTPVAEGPPPPAEKIVVEEKFLIQFMASPEFVAKFQKMKELLSNKIPDGACEAVLQEAIEDYLKRHDPEAKEKPKRKRSTPASGTARRHSTRDREEIWARDGGRCTFVGSDGRRCPARSYLEVDHSVPYARGGESSVENGRLLCSVHNLFEAKRVFGREFIQRKIVKA